MNSFETLDDATFQPLTDDETALVAGCVDYVVTYINGPDLIISYPPC